MVFTDADRSLVNKTGQIDLLPTEQKEEKGVYYLSMASNFTSPGWLGALVRSPRWAGLCRLVSGNPTQAAQA